MKKLLLVDGNSVLFRAYYATAYGAKMTSLQGLPTNAVFGFANMFAKSLELVEPDSVLVAFDAGKHTFRHDIYPDYKGGRKPAPDDLVPQFAMVRDYLSAFHVKWVEMQDIEADDLIGTMARKSVDYKTTILSSDHDLLQLIDESTTVMLMKKGLTEMEEMTVSRMKDEMGIEPLQIIDMKGLMGDHSDNIPGVPGIGEKGALKLLQEYGSVENVLDHEYEIKGATGKKIVAGHDSALMSKKLATIYCDAPLDFNADDCIFTPDYPALIRFFDSLNMKSQVRKYQAFAEKNEIKSEGQPVSTTKAEKTCICPQVLLTQDCAVYLENTKDLFYKAEMTGLAISNGTYSVYMSLNDVKNDQNLLDYLADEQHVKIGFDIKRNMHLLSKEGITIHFTDDALMTATLANSTLSDYEKIFAAYGLSTSKSYEDIYGTIARPKLVDEQESIRYCCEYASNIFRIYQDSITKINEFGMMSLYRDIEMPLTGILYQMEKEGIRCEKEILKQISAQMNQQMDELKKQIYTDAGKEFNINSPKQLAEILYDELQILSGKKRSTSADVLEKVIGIHPIIERILLFRKFSKINSTYAEGLQKSILTDGKIHTTYNQCVTTTGRLSSSDPNLQNISVRDELGKSIRKAFLPEEGHVLLGSDYHQIELRMLASMADEESMIDAFNKDIDIHTKTAMDVFGVEQDEVTSLMRRRAKTVNFGIVYGISDFGLGEQLGISRREASQFIKTYYEKYPKIQSYMNGLISFCQEHGYVTTLCGRRREIPEIKDKSHMVREFGKRAAMNAPIQGSAADLIKIAMIRIDEIMKQKNVRSKMILQVHDELIFDVPLDEVDLMKTIVEQGMINAMKLKVPLTVECSIGNSWYEAK